jgi:hypothetical protein
LFSNIVVRTRAGVRAKRFELSQRLEPVVKLVDIYPRDCDCLSGVTSTKTSSAQSSKRFA